MRVLIRGAGDIATGIALRLYRSHMQVVMTDLPAPTAIRRTVCFSQAIVLGRTEVEGVAAVLAADAAEAESLLAQEVIPVLADPECRRRQTLRPDAEVDAILAKRNLGTALTDAPIVLALGPGFTAGVDCHGVVETKRGHYLGRLILAGSAIPNTGVPGDIGGYSAQRIIRATADGIFEPEVEIGQRVETGALVARVDGTPVYDIKPYLPFTDSHPDAASGFAGKTGGDRLDAVIPERLAALIPEDKREPLLGILRSDPRPSYQNEPDRVYGFVFAGAEIRFRVTDGIAEVVDVK